MPIIIGGTDRHPGPDNHLRGGAGSDYIVGDPYTTGSPDGVPDLGGVLSTADGGD
ncbi:MAG: calcium-binding protein, partial [Rhodomicrobium sp.]|nr:calcium-binding protein [Rhodomicrobium sp.]